MSTSILIYILIFAIVLIILWIITIEHRIKRFFVGTKAKNLEEVMIQLNEQMAELKENHLKINKHLIVVDNRLNKSIRNIETCRFNPFGDAGSNQSFAISFLNDEGNGVLMSSLYARDRMSIFAKPIINGKSDFELSKEESDVLKKALKK